MHRRPTFPANASVALVTIGLFASLVTDTAGAAQLVYESGSASVLLFDYEDDPDGGLLLEDAASPLSSFEIGWGSLGAFDTPVLLTSDVAPRALPLAASLSPYGVVDGDAFFWYELYFTTTERTDALLEASLTGNSYLTDALRLTLESTNSLGVTSTIFDLARPPAARSSSRRRRTCDPPLSSG